jgi:DNA ligase (NAD+)
MEKTRYNEDFIKILGELYTIYNQQGEPFRAKAYQKAQETIMTFNTNIIEPTKQLKGLPGIGDTILAKFEEYVKTGTLAILEKERNNPINLFTQIHGIGPKKAQELIGMGITTIDQLKSSSVKLNDIQKLGLKYFEDINQRIPRKEIDEFFIKFASLFQEHAPSGSKFDIVGSYRRGLSDSGDIDIIITNEHNDSSVLNIILDKLTANGIILEFLSRGKIKSMVIAKTNPDESERPARRIDFLYSPPDEFAFAHLYFTGSKIFNTIVRQKALNMGFTLNEHGLCHMTKSVKGDKLTELFPDEKSILNFLAINYVEPEKRIDGKCISSSKKKIDSEKVFENKEEKFKIIPNTKNKTLKNMKSDNTSTYIEKFKKDGITALKMMTEKELTNLLNEANKAYYIDAESIMSDNLYDILREYTLEKYPKNTLAKEGHASCDISVEKNKVKLPYELWSMDKIKSESSAVQKWTQKFSGPYVISCKLDGISALYVGGETPDLAKLYTRGNGIYGQDISHFIPYLIKQNSDFEISFVLRGEIIIKKDVFQKKYADKFANPRNFVAGIINKKTIDPEIINDLDFVAYEVIEPQLSPMQQMKFIEDEWIISPVKYTLKENISNEILSEMLLSWRENYEYEIDGIIIVNDEIYPRPKKNPDYAFAFKMVLSENVVEAKVVDVLWSPSKDGYLKPRVQIEKIVLGGVTIEYATGFNAKYISDNNIGIGSLISITRSGDVIPHIISVVVPADKPLMPSGEYKWNETGVDIILDNKDENSIVKEKNITGFFKGICVIGLGAGNVIRIMNAGFDTIPKIIAMKKSDFLEVEGFKKTLATKIFTNIHTQLEKVSFAELIAASNIFGRGFGVKRLNAILEVYPNILTSDLDSDISNCDKVAQLIKIDGLANKTAKKFVEQIPVFVDFMKEAKLTINTSLKSEAEKSKESSLYDKKIIMTGFRDKELEEKIKALGGEITSSVSKNTFVVIVKNDIETITTKTKSAKELNIPIMISSEFTEKYIN